MRGYPMERNLLAKLVLDNASLDTESVGDSLQYILKAIRSHLQMDVAFISEFTRGARVFKFVDARKDQTKVVVGEGSPLEQSYAHKIIQGELPHLIPDARVHPVTSHLAITHTLNIGAYIGVPIRLGDGSIYGAFSCYSHQADHTLVERDVALLRIFADYVAQQLDSYRQKSHHLCELRKRVTALFGLSTISMLYQPIYNLGEKRVIGFEALARFATEPYQSPDKWFREAQEVGMGERLELLAVRHALQGLRALPQDVYLSVNISPAYILNGAIVTALEGVPADRLVLEITEHVPVADYCAFREALLTLRARGIRLAIDDAGAGYSSFAHILELGVDIIKLDFSLIRNLHKDLKRRALTSALIAFAKEIQCVIIAEGVESQEELNELRRLGVNKVQGYFIAHPLPLTQASCFTLGET
jgi:EAL domain-containing protein (putative c-di-GMP-specific phosphodiesterase class I)